MTRLGFWGLCRRLILRNPEEQHCCVSRPVRRSVKLIVERTITVCSCRKIFPTLGCTRSCLEGCPSRRTMQWMLCRPGSIRIRVIDVAHVSEISGSTGLLGLCFLP